MEQVNSCRTHGVDWPYQFRTSCNNSIIVSIELVSKQAVQGHVTASFELLLDILGPIVNKRVLMISCNTLSPIVDS